jgi:hypothetical protein
MHASLSSWEEVLSRGIFGKTMADEVAWIEKGTAATKKERIYEIRNTTEGFP